MRKLLLLAGLLACIACGRKESKTTGLYSVDSRIILGTPTPTRLSEIAKNAEFIQLETPDSTFIGNNPSYAFNDSLLVVYSDQTGVFVFDSRTGKFKYRIIGFNDPGPLGYNGGPWPISADNKGRILLYRDGRPGIWNYITGKKMGEIMPVERHRYFTLLMVNDTLLLGRAGINRNFSSMLDLVSTGGEVVREYGFVGQLDNPNWVLSYRYHIYDSGDQFTYYDMICDTIYGIDKKSFALEPRIVLNIGDKLLPDGPIEEVRPKLGNHFRITNICESNRYLFISYSYNHPQAHLIFYDKKNRKTVYVDNRDLIEKENAGFTDDMTGTFKFFPNGITSDGRAYMVIPAYQFIEWSPERAAEMGVAEEDNPVVMVVELKK